MEEEAGELDSCYYLNTMTWHPLRSLWYVTESGGGGGGGGAMTHVLFSVVSNNCCSVLSASPYAVFVSFIYPFSPLSSLFLMHLSFSSIPSIVRLVHSRHPTYIVIVPIMDQSISIPYMSRPSSLLLTLLAVLDVSSAESSQSSILCLSSLLFHLSISPSISVSPLNRSL